MAKQIICKSCQQPCIVDGNEITCETCGTTFVRQGDTVKAVKIGRLDKIEKTLTELQEAIKTNIGPIPAQKSEPERELEQEQESDQDENEDW